MSRSQRKADAPFVIRQSKIQGRGGYATRDIRKGERIVEYLGERISWAEADRRYDDTKMTRHHTFLFTVNRRTIIDAAVGGNDARFINHSCAPNCEAVEEGGRIYIEAIRDIPKDEELVYDYAYARDKETTEADEALYVCRCGAPTCRGSILEPGKPKPTATHHAAARQAHEHRKPARTRRRTSGGAATRAKTRKRAVRS
ncbi:MAG: SET domain-containing protein [Gemmatimonadaceae bacterium]